MKYCIFLITLLSLFAIIYSECTTGVNVSGDDTEKCGTEITGCTKYDVTSTSAAPKCATCTSGKAASSDKSIWEKYFIQ